MKVYILDVEIPAIDQVEKHSYRERYSHLRSGPAPCPMSDGVCKSSIEIADRVSSKTPTFFFLGRGVIMHCILVNSNQLVLRHE